MKPVENGTVERVARGLGWFSIGLGIAELTAPQAVGRLAGLRDVMWRKRERRHKMLRAHGVREIATGVGILTQRRPGPWLWGRVAGDAVDLASLGSASTDRRTHKRQLAITALSVAGVAALDVMCARRLTEKVARIDRVSRSVIIDRPAQEVYEFWRNFANFPRFMRFIEAAERIGGSRVHFRARTPMGRVVEWESEIMEDRPGEITWRTDENAPLPHSGVVCFEEAPGKPGTLVRVELQFHQRIGKIAKALGGPQIVLEKNLRALKQILETGEVLQSDSSIYPGMHAAQPAERSPEFASAR